MKEPKENKTLAAKKDDKNKTASFAAPAKNATAFAEPAKNKSSLAEPAKNKTALAEPAKNKTSLAEPTKNKSALAEPAKNATSLAEPAKNQTLASDDKKDEKKAPSLVQEEIDQRQRRKRHHKKHKKHHKKHYSSDSDESDEEPEQHGKGDKANLMTRNGAKDDDIFNEENAEDQEILKSIAYAENKLGSKMSTPQVVKQENPHAPIKFDVEMEAVQTRTQSGIV